jgi:hypothetical protein
MLKNTLNQRASSDLPQGVAAKPPVAIKLFHIFFR